MLDFELDHEHRLIEQSVRDWAAREVSPRIRERDRQHTFDRVLPPQMAALGLLGIVERESPGVSSRTREIHKLMQADDLLGYRTDRAARCELPPWQES